MGIILLEHFLVIYFSKTLATNNWKTSSVTSSIGNSGIINFVNNTKLSSILNGVRNNNGVFTTDNTRNNGNWWLLFFPFQTSIVVFNCQNLKWYLVTIRMQF